MECTSLPAPSNSKSLVIAGLEPNSKVAASCRTPRSPAGAFWRCSFGRQHDQSLKNFNRSIELFPSYFQALAERGHLLMAMGKLPEALKDFQRALELNARYGVALHGSGLRKFQQGKYAEANQELERPGLNSGYWR